MTVGDRRLPSVTVGDRPCEQSQTCGFGQSRGPARTPSVPFTVFRGRVGAVKAGSWEISTPWAGPYVQSDRAMEPNLFIISCFLFLENPPKNNGAGLVGE